MENSILDKCKVTNYADYKIDGELVTCTKVKLLIIDAPDGNNYLNLDNRGWCNPIIVATDNEPYDIGDNVYYHGKLIRDVPGLIKGIGVKKVLVLPEMFSAKQRSAIYSGELKDGDELLLECEGFMKTVCPPEDYQIDEFIKNGLLFTAVKFTKKDTVKLHKLTEPSYTLADVERIAIDFANYCHSNHFVGNSVIFEKYQQNKE